MKIKGIATHFHQWKETTIPTERIRLAIKIPPIQRNRSVVLSPLLLVILNSLSYGISRKQPKENLTQIKGRQKMTIVMGDKKVQDVGTWQEFFVPTYSERIRKAKERTMKTPEICLGRARAEMKAYEQYKNEPRIIQRARFLETYLREKAIYILEDELIVGNINSKVRGIAISGTVAPFSPLFVKGLNDMMKGFEAWFKGVIYPEERKELEEVILPYFNGKTFMDYNFERVDPELKEKAYPLTSSCPHIPNGGGASMWRDAGHQMPNHEKVLFKGLKGIREEVEWYISQLGQSYSHFDLKEKLDFYKAVLITLDAAMAYSKRYADLARAMASNESDPKRKKELDRIAEVCEWVPANPARDWWEAVQSVWMIHVIQNCELTGEVNSFGRFDQFMFPFYKKWVIDNKTMTHDEALELLECFQTKIDCGMENTQSLTIGGQTYDGKDACNEVTMLCLEAEEQLNIIQP
jgi:pyruvate-formate lyase